MLSASVRLIAFGGALVASIALAGTVEKTIDPYFKAVLDARVAVAPPNGSDGPEKIDRLFESIESLAKRGKKADKLLVDLFDYYLGEGPATDVATFIVERGSRMIPILTEKKRHPLNCLPVYKSICRDDVENRNDLIDSLINEIKNAKKPA